MRYGVGDEGPRAPPGGAMQGRRYRRRAGWAPDSLGGMAETTSSPNAASTEAYRAAVSTSLQRLGEHRLRAAIFWEFVVILGMGVTAVIKSLVHWRWWSTANVITAYEVFGDTISPM